MESSIWDSERGNDDRQSKKMMKLMEWKGIDVCGGNQAAGAEGERDRLQTVLRWGRWSEERGGNPTDPGNQKGRARGEPRVGQSHVGVAGCGKSNGQCGECACAPSWLCQPGKGGIPGTDGRRIAVDR